MTTLAAGWENMGGRRLRRSAGTPTAEQGDTITHPLRKPLLSSDDTLGQYRKVF